MEYATAIPVAVTPLPSDPKKTTIKRVAAPTSTVFLPGNKTSRNIIFAGNTLPQGAIPIQINGLNAIPLSAVKSLPISISNINNAAGVQTVAKRTKVEIIPANAKTTLTSALPVVTKVTNNNTGSTSGISQVNIEMLSDPFRSFRIFSDPFKFFQILSHSHKFSQIHVIFLDF